MGTSDNLLVSVIVITYNQQDYIAQALDSILMQKTNFNFEILIGDDASTDKTTDIIKDYIKKYPDRIRGILRKKNIGPTKNDYFLKMKAKGSYIAQLEGDDFWTDKYKLQQQVDFLNSNKDYIACTHHCSILSQDGGESNFSGLAWVNFHKNQYEKQDFENWLLPGHYSSLLYRNIFKTMDCSALYKMDYFVGDRTLALILVLSGRIYCFETYMGCYRYIVKEKGQNWSSINQKNLYDSFRDYLYISKLEQFAKKKFGVLVDVKFQKQQLLMAAYKNFRENYQFSSFFCFYRMWKKSNHKVRDFISCVFFDNIQEAVIQGYDSGNGDGFEDMGLTWHSFRKKYRNRKLILFGAGVCCEGFLDRYRYYYMPYMIVDNNKNKWGSYFHGLRISSPDSLSSFQEDQIVVLITTVRYISDIRKQLKQMGIMNASFVNLEGSRIYYKCYRWLNKLE